MNEKIEMLKDLIEKSMLAPQLKLNKIIQTLQRTEDIMKAKMLSEKILTGDFSSLKEKSIDDLIGAFENSEINHKEESDTSRKEQLNRDDENLKNEIKTLKLQMEAIEHNHNKEIKELEEKNKRLISILVLTKNSKLIEVSDEDINELYLRYLQDEITAYNSAFIVDDIIPKSYYKIKRSGGEKC